VNLLKKVNWFTVLLVLVAVASFLGKVKFPGMYGFREGL
jgi:hypothetical protein